MSVLHDDLGWTNPFKRVAQFDQPRSGRIRHRRAVRAGVGRHAAIRLAPPYSTRTLPVDLQTRCSPWARFRPVGHSEHHADSVSSALSDVDIGWTSASSLLSIPTSLEILLSLHRVPGICVGDLAEAVGRSNSVSQALRVLRQQGWVSSTRVGRQVQYQLDDQTVHRLLHWIGAAHSS